MRKTMAVLLLFAMFGDTRADRGPLPTSVIYAATVPFVDTIAPTSGGPNTIINIIGSNLTRVTTVSLGAISTSFSILQPTQIRVVVPTINVAVSTPLTITVGNAAGQNQAKIVFVYVPPTCHDSIKNQDESDVDCGGSCGACGTGHTCSRNADCVTSNCSGGLCRPRVTCNGSPDTGQASNITVLARDAIGCGWTYTIFANTLNDARDCTRNAGLGLSPVSQLCQFWVQIDSGSQSLITSDSDADALNCALVTVCSNCSLSIAEHLSCVFQ